MKVYSPNDIASLLNLSTGTLRKYSRILEKYGYQIGRNTQGHRFYQDKDILTLRNVMSGLESGIPLEQTIQNVVSLEKGSPEEDETPAKQFENTSDIDELKDIVNKQNDLLRQLSDRMDEQSKQISQQQEYIDKRLDEINSSLAQSQDEQVMQSINQAIDTRKRIAAAREIQEEEKEKRGFWKKLFGIGKHKE